MTAGWLPREPAEVFGAGATAAEAYGVLTADVPAAGWTAALTAARDGLGCTFFDWLSAVDEPGTGFLVLAHVVALGAPPRRLLLRTVVPHEAAALPTATGVYAGAAWHERETHEMFGIDFPGHPGLAPLLLPDAFEGHPLRKDFVLAARVAKAWPGAKEPGEPGHGGPRRRQALPPGVPDPNEWGPLKGRAPAAPARRARSASGAGGAAATPAPAPEGAPPGAPERAPGSGRAARPARPRRNRSASGGSASQRASAPEAELPPEADAPRESDSPEPGARRGDSAPWQPPGRSAAAGRRSGVRPAHDGAAGHAADDAGAHDGTGPGPDGGGTGPGTDSGSTGPDTGSTGSTESGADGGEY
ncbi:NADH-quinone oxidoreductase subunit C [Streptomyces marincola]|uniref:NADH-quinone oxidoreductase subunit C n=1 Tax=Streptomyces marincola TaxID=2878388 RepID=UPI001CF53D8B|nr:NADH-quinone oxidoreductase subunit C [Streptomyces marincola]UCM89690.1 NADH-quinone oxidoreductase subunit C [Streptomyces marincola]